MAEVAFKAGRDTGSFENYLMGNSRNRAPEVGMGATELCWTDRHAYTITRIISPRRIAVKQDKASRTDMNGMSESQEYRYEPNPDAPETILFLNKRNQWKEQGGGSVFAIGYRSEYYDYTF